MKRGVRLENVFLASFYIPLKAFLYKKRVSFQLKKRDSFLYKNNNL